MTGLGGQDLNSHIQCRGHKPPQPPHWGRVHFFPTPLPPHSNSCTSARPSASHRCRCTAARSTGRPVPSAAWPATPTALGTAPSAPATSLQPRGRSPDCISFVWPLRLLACLQSFVRHHRTPAVQWEPVGWMWGGGGLSVHLQHSSVGECIAQGRLEGGVPLFS